MSNRSKSIPPSSSSSLSTASVTPRNKATDSNGAGAAAAAAAGKRRSVSNNGKSSRRDSSSSMATAAAAMTSSSSSSVDPLLRDGDVFYRTVLVQQGVEPEVSLTFVRPSDVVVAGSAIPEKGLAAMHGGGGGAGKEKARTSVEIRSSLDKRPSSLVPPPPSSGSVGAECRSTSPARDDQKERLQTQVIHTFFIIQTLPRSQRLTLTRRLSECGSMDADIGP